MLDDRVCPACQVLLKVGTSTCSKCGRTVEQKTNISFIDLPTKLHPWFVRHFGSFWGGVTSCLLFLMLLLLLLFKVVMKLIESGP